jgi:hypothetical protein
VKCPFAFRYARLTGKRLRCTQNAAHAYALLHLPQAAQRNAAIACFAWATLIRLLLLLIINLSFSLSWKVKHFPKKALFFPQGYFYPL